MAGNLQADNSGNILVDFDYNNIIVVDPNKTIDNFGNIRERLVDHENTKKLHEFMKEWWESFGKYKKCMACSKLLPIDFSTINVDHLVSKKVYPQFAFDVNNFYLCCGDCHHAKELGFPKEHHKQAIINFKKTI